FAGGDSAETGDDTLAAQAGAGSQHSAVVVVDQTPAGGRIVQLADDHGVEAAAQALDGDALAAGRTGRPVGAEVAVCNVAIAGAAAFTGTVGPGIARQISAQHPFTAGRAAGTAGGIVRRTGNRAGRCTGARRLLWCGRADTAHRDRTRRGRRCTAQGGDLKIIHIRTTVSRG